MEKITLQEIEIFVTVAEQLSLSGAARELFMDQSAVSRWIQRLEASLNTQLFVRKAKGVTLTTSGEFLYWEFRPLLDHINFSLKNIQAIYNAQNDVLRIGCYHSHTLINEFLDQTKSFEATHPENKIKISLFDYKSLIESLLQKELDCAVAYEIGFSYPTNLEMKRFYRPACNLSIAADHPLIRDGRLNFSDLSAEPLLLIMTPEFTLSEEWKIDICKQNGFFPKSVEYVASPLDREIAIKNHRGFSIGGNDQNYHFQNEIKLFPLKHVQKRQSMVVVWRKHSLPGPVKELIDSLQNVES